MTTLTFGLELTEDWVEIANSDTHVVAALYYESGSVLVCVSDTLPLPDEENCVVMSSAVFTLALEMPKDFKLYARSKSGTSHISGYRRLAPGNFDLAAAPPSYLVVPIPPFPPEGEKS